MVEPAIFGPVDAVLAPYVEYLVLVLVLGNMATRFVSYRRHKHQANEDGADAIERYSLHEVTNVLLVLGSFYLLTLHHHAGVVLSTLVLGVVIADLFEFEARKVEARHDRDIEAPKAAIAGSMLVLAYIAYLSLFFLVKPYWELVV